jgi:hypothetical protein
MVLTNEELEYLIQGKEPPPNLKKPSVEQIQQQQPKPQKKVKTLLEVFK